MDYYQPFVGVYQPLTLVHRTKHLHILALCRKQVQDRQVKMIQMNRLDLKTMIARINDVDDVPARTKMNELLFTQVMMTVSVQI